MSTRDEVLTLLQREEGSFVSGERMAEILALSRESVRIAVAELQSEGYRVDAVRRQGYRLLPDSDVLSQEGIQSRLRHNDLVLHVKKKTGSTNTDLKKMAAQGAPEGTVVIAQSQTEGRGRLGRSFYSPMTSGLYMSLLLRPQISIIEALNLTTCAAVAVAETIEEISGRDAQIKWVNDVYVGRRKVCGILTEAELDLERGMAQYCVVGIGVNTAVPEGGFPEEIRDIAGAAFERTIPDLRCRLAAGILDRIMDYYARLSERSYYEAYRSRSLVLGRRIKILKAGGESVSAEALDIDRDFALIVRHEDGSIQRIQSGEVSIRLDEGDQE